MIFSYKVCQLSLIITGFPDIRFGEIIEILPSATLKYALVALAVAPNPVTSKFISSDGLYSAGIFNAIFAVESVVVAIDANICNSTDFPLFVKDHVEIVSGESPRLILAVRSCVAKESFNELTL